MAGSDTSVSENVSCIGTGDREVWGIDMKSLLAAALALAVARMPAVVLAERSEVETLNAEQAPGPVALTDAEMDAAPHGPPRSDPGDMSPPTWKARARPLAWLPDLPTTVALGLVARGLVARGASVHEGTVLGRSSHF
jgi:hypothetical protein